MSPLLWPTELRARAGVLPSGSGERQTDCLRLQVAEQVVEGCHRLLLHGNGYARLQVEGDADLAVATSTPTQPVTRSACLPGTTCSP